MASTTASLPDGSRSRSAFSGRGPLWRRAGAIALARVSSVLVGAAHHNGTSLPGTLADVIWPGALASLSDQLGSTIVVVGTNGKTTTAALIERMIRTSDRRPIANRSGANMRQGVVTSLVRESDLRGHLRGGRDDPRDAVFEVDEAALELILPAIGPAIIVATNLFRDQLDRYGEADSIVDRWTVELASAAAGSTLIHCADDARLAMLAQGSGLPSRTFGLAGPPDDRTQPGPDDAQSDPVACRTCGRQLVFRWHSIGHLGDFACPQGHICRRAPDVAVRLHAGSGETVDRAAPAGTVTLDLAESGRTVIARPGLVGLANAYNVAAAATAAMAVGRDLAGSAATIRGYAGPYGRLERIEIDGRHVILILVKNTVSLGETVRIGPQLAPDSILLALNDAPADGRDVSWIWDAPIASLVAGRDVVVTGTRADDLGLRLRYDTERVLPGPSSVTATTSLAAGLDAALARTPPGGTLLAGATYTAMMGLRAHAERRGDARPAPL